MIITKINSKSIGLSIPYEVLEQHQLNPDFKLINGTWNPDIKQWIFPIKEHHNLCSILDQRQILYKSMLYRKPLQEIQLSQIESSQNLSNYTPELSCIERVIRLERIMGLQNSPPRIQSRLKFLNSNDVCGIKSFNENDSYQGDDEISPLINKFNSCKLQEKVGRKLQFE